jgi:hypothetical protein
VLGVLVTLIHDPDALVESPHRVVDLETEFFPQPDMILKRRRKVAQHRIIFGGQGDQLNRVGRHDLVLAPIEIFQTACHVQGGADIQAAPA